MLRPIRRNYNIYILDKKQNRRAPLLIINFCMPVSRGPSQESLKKIQAFEMRCYRRLLNISYTDCVANEELLIIFKQPFGRGRETKVRFLTLSQGRLIPQGIVKGIGTVDRQRGQN